ncbi:hypothetical protein AUR64_13835 [Haloprofundus marisrubri]|uniref:Uncharacterized protein n=1 Tax=Haloprofundus marisrubri TaxID=1514971 RepID=A0A0W1R712_9EURY|nr:hypothetical protein [Haloprofundus marisrubri]KTG08887.1 hypothetical protein AUR64_13835 [Haloprofundus marisrubri]
MALRDIDSHTKIERRTIAGQEARVYLDPDEIHVEWRPGRAVYLGVRVGDRIKDADRDVASPRIDEWEVEEITAERVVGRSVKTGDRREWDRETLERGLVVGNYATNLTEFATVLVHEIGVHGGRDPYVTVVAYGDNGEKYGRRYGFVDADDRTVEFRDQDPAVDRLPTEMATVFDELVDGVLVDDGYTIR